MKTKKRRGRFSRADVSSVHFFLILLLAGVFCGLLYFVFFAPTLKNEPEQYSVVLYQYTDSEWTSLLEGIRQAEEDEGVLVNYVTTPLGASADDEAELIRREIENGADGILLAPVDSAALADEIEELAGTLPVVTLETGLGEEEADSSGDNYAMGQLLGLHVADEMQMTGERTVCIICEYTQRQSVARRYQGFVDALTEAVPDAVLQDYRRSEGDFSLPVCIANLYGASSGSMYVAALDKYCTEALIEAAGSPALSREVREELGRHAFGIGNTEATVNGLDTGKLSGLVYQNEFNMGYQGLQTLIRRKRNEKSDESPAIAYDYVTRSTLYDPENQRLLFPLK